MPKVLCLLFLLLPGLLWAATPACFQGEWVFDAKNSDNADRLMKKLERKQKQQQKVLYRPSGFQGDETQDLSLIDTLPTFVFMQENLWLEVLPTEVLLKQGEIVRRISTNGPGQALSLKMLQEQSESRVAGWEKDSLVVETTTIDGSKVKEVFSIDDGNSLRVEITILQGFEKEIVMGKTYLRKDDSAACSEYKNN